MLLLSLCNRCSHLHYSVTGAAIYTTLTAAQKCSHIHYSVIGAAIYTTV